MKKRILALSMVLALLAILAIPMAAFADTTGTTTIGGTDPTTSSTISITAPGAISFGTFTVGADNLANSTDGVVTYTQGNDGASGWQITAKDYNQSTHSGYMLKGTTPLAGELNISPDGSTYSVASTGFTNTGSTSGSFALYAKQHIVSTDLAGSYTITIEFDASTTM